LIYNLLSIELDIFEEKYVKWYDKKLKEAR